MTGPASGYGERRADGDESMIAVTAEAKKLFYVGKLRPAENVAGQLLRRTGVQCAKMRGIAEVLRSGADFMMLFHK